MIQPIPDVQEQLQAMRDRLHAEMGDAPRIDFARRDEMVTRITKAQMRQLKTAKVIWALGVLILVVSTIAGWMQWYWAIPAVPAWMLMWSFISNRAIEALAKFRIKRQTLRLMVQSRR